MLIHIPADAGIFYSKRRGCDKIKKQNQGPFPRKWQALYWCHKTLLNCEAMPRLH